MTEKKKNAHKQPDVGRPSVFAITFSATGSRLKNFRTLNLIFAGLYALQAVVLICIAHGVSLPVSASYLTRDPLQSAAQGKNILTVATHHLFDVNILWLVVAALLLAAIFSLLVATRYMARYEAELSEGRASLRWLQYSVTSSLIVVVLALVLGVQDVSLLVAAVLGSAVFHLGCLYVERIHKPGEPIGRLLYGLGLGVGFVSVIAPIVYLASAVEYSQAVPAYVYWLAATLLAIFIPLVGNFILQRKKVGRWASFAFGERVFMVLALATQSLLAWQLYAGAFR